VVERNQIHTELIHTERKLTRDRTNKAASPRITKLFQVYSPGTLYWMGIHIPWKWAILWGFRLWSNLDECVYGYSYKGVHAAAMRAFVRLLWPRVETWRTGCGVAGVGRSARLTGHWQSWVGALQDDHSSRRAAGAHDGQRRARVSRHLGDDSGRRRPTRAARQGLPVCQVRARARAVPVVFGFSVYLLPTVNLVPVSLIICKINIFNVAKTA